MSSNSERVKRWRDKHRGLHNLRRRKAYQERKNLSGVGQKSCQANPVASNGGTVVAPPAQNPTIQALRQLIKNPVQAEPKPSIYRNDNGQVISERVWNQLQERKAKAKAGNYVLDEYSQT